MRSPTVFRALPLLALGLAVTSLIGGCFNDTLTTRGFIAEGDQICINTLVRNGLRLGSHTNVSGSQFLASVGNALEQTAAGFRKLKVRSEDEAMRTRIVTGYGSFGRRLQAASRAPTPASAASQARATFSAISVLNTAMRNYGFQACGGGPTGARK